MNISVTTIAADGTKTTATEDLQNVPSKGDFVRRSGVVYRINEVVYVPADESAGFVATVSADYHYTLPA